MRRSSLALGGLLGIIFTWYVITNVAYDAVSILFPNASIMEAFQGLMGILAATFVLLTFVYAVKEKNVPILLIFLIFAILIILAGGITVGKVFP